MKLPILFAAVSLLMPATAQAQARFEQAVGNWSVGGEGGDCAASTIVGDDLVMIYSPASGGENHGGITVSRFSLTVADDEQATLVLSGNWSWAGKHSVIGYADPAGYWTAFPSDDTADEFPDGWTSIVRRDGNTLITVSVKGFAAALPVLHACVEKTR